RPAARVQVRGQVVEDAVSVEVREVRPRGAAEPGGDGLTLRSAEGAGAVVAQHRHGAEGRVVAHRRLRARVQDVHVAVEVDVSELHVRVEVSTLDLGGDDRLDGRGER